MGPLNDALIHLGYYRPEIFAVLLNQRAQRIQAAVVSLTRELNFAPLAACIRWARRSEEHTSELQSPCNLVCRLLLEKKKIQWFRRGASHNKSEATEAPRAPRHVGVPRRHVSHVLLPLICFLAVVSMGRRAYYVPTEQ